MLLSQKRKSVSQFFAAFLKARLSFKYMGYKEDPHRICIFRVTDSENLVR